MLASWYLTETEAEAGMKASKAARREFLVFKSQWD